MSRISLDELAHALPTGDEFRTTRALDGIGYVESNNPRFVDPDLEVITPIVANHTSVILLSAPGAVGKSTLASELASRTKSLLWDLSKFQVGSRTFSGTVFEAFDFHATGVQKRFQNGTFLFVFDALDEAQVRAGASNFDAFLAELAAALREPREKPTLVLLARTDTADWMKLFLEEEGVPLAHFQITYFDHARAVTFLEKRLDYRRSIDGRPPMHRQQAKPFSEARSLLFGIIYKLFGASELDAWSDSQVRDFLGYAPVLEALTDYLDVPNYMSLIQELKEDEGVAEDPWEFLVDIVNRLLTREERKVQHAVRDQLEVPARENGWLGFDEIYGHKEQCARVLAHSIRVPAMPVPLAMPGPVARVYEEALKTIMPQHPFLSGREFANVVFKEYCYAWGIMCGDGRLSDALRETTRDRERPFLPSQLFGHFLLSMTEGGAPVLDGQDFGVLYESVLARAKVPFLDIIQDESSNIRASLSLHGEDSEVTIEILDTGSGLHFWRHLGNAEVRVKIPVRLGLPDQRFVIGPAVDLECGELVVSSEDFESDVTDDIRIRADSYVQTVPSVRLRVRNEKSGTLAVDWPNISHPWSAHRSAELGQAMKLTESVRGDTLRKFILMFRRQRTRKRSTLMTARWSPEQESARDELITLALRWGVLVEVPGRDIYEFDSTYSSLRTLISGVVALSPRATEFAVEYLGAKELGQILRS